MSTVLKHLLAPLPILHPFPRISGVRLPPILTDGEYPLVLSSKELISPRLPLKLKHPMMNLILTSILRPVLEMDSLSRLFPLSRELILMELVLPSTLVTTLRPKSLMLSSTTTRTELRLPSLLPKTLNLLLSPVSSMMRIELLLP